jgi:hypothetical protein
MTTAVLNKNRGDDLVSEALAFDENGRCVPDNDLSAPAHMQTRRYFQIDQPEIDFQEIYQRLDNAFDIAGHISVDEFKSRVDNVLKTLAEDENTKNILNGVKVPFILPKASYDDIGHALETDYIPAVEQAFSSVFPDYDFTNHSSKSLEKQLLVRENGRHQQLIDKMKDDVVVGVYFPCMLEYSVPATVEQVVKLPAPLLLAGGYDTAAAFISMPNLLFRKDGYPPLLWLSGLTSVEENVGYHFEAYGYDLTFNRRVHLEQVAEYWAHGLSILG